MPVTSRPALALAGVVTAVWLSSPWPRAASGSRGAGITAADLEYVVFFEKPFVKFERLLLTSCLLYTSPSPRDS